MLQTFTQRVLSRRVSWSVWMRERSSSGTEALSSPWRREATSKQDRGHLRPQPSTLKRVLLLLPARLYSLSVCVCSECVCVRLAAGLTCAPVLSVRQLHREFLRAGANVMQTFTFYASEDKLENRGNKQRFTVSTAVCF